MKTIRAFIAVNLPDEVKEELDRVSRRLADQIPSKAVRWVKPDRIHLTLRFLGDTPLEKLPAIASNLDLITRQYPFFKLHLDLVGCFPNHKRPRVIWVGMAGDTHTLNSLKKGIDGILAPLSWEVEERAFRPHLTLGRVKDSRHMGDVKWDIGVENKSMEVTDVHLIESQLRPSGPIYTVRHTSKLAKP